MHLRAMLPLASVAILLAAQVTAAADPDDDLAEALEHLRAVSADGQGNVEAAAAFRRLMKSDARSLPRILSALDGAGPLAANWLRAAIDAISQRELERGGRLPANELQAFVRDVRHEPRARRLAFEWLARVDAEASEQLIPTMSQDPSVELRRDAIARLVDRGQQLIEAKQDTEAREVFRTALNGARDEDQIRTIVERLKVLGQEVDLPRHFGFLMHWKVIGPFDNRGREGFAASYPPEEKLDAAGQYAGVGGDVQWKDYVTTDDYGMVDFNSPFGKLKEATAYAWTEFTSDGEREAEIRLGCKNAWKVWLNGKLLFSRDEYHRGMSLDQYRLPVTLEAGRNEILVKACQNEEQEEWTVEWQFQLRVCDSAGTAILSQTRP